MSAFNPGEFLTYPSLPSAEDAFFRSQGDWLSNACLHYAPDRWLIYALGYKEAADRLAAQLRDERGRLDLLVYPIVFLYRQYLELAVKGLIQQAQTLLELPTKLPMSHRIDQLWAECSKLLELVSPGDSIEEQRQIGRLLQEFSSVDPSSTAFRYPVDAAGNVSVPTIENINVQNVCDVVGKVSVILDGASSQMDYYASNMPGYC
jgi:hypothetical protein